MKIFIYSYGIPSRNYPTYGIFAFDQAKSLKSIGHDVYLIILDLRSIRHRRKLFFDLYEKESIHICKLSLPVGRMPGYLHDQLDIFFSKILFKKAIKTYGKPQIIHSHFLRQGYSISRLFSIKEVKLFCTIHDSHLMNSITDEDKTKLIRIKANSILITVSPNLNYQLQSIGISSIIVNNVIDERIFEFSSEKQKNKGNYALSAGALIFRKGMKELISVWKDLPDFITTKLVILGDGPEYASLNKFILNYGLSHRIELRGKFSRNQFADYLNNAKYFVLASKQESFGVVYAESLMKGIPVIATKCGGPDYLINESNGLLVGVDNHDDMLRAITFMEKNYSAYEPDIISANILKEYGSKAVANKLINLYKKVI